MADPQQEALDDIINRAQDFARRGWGCPPGLVDRLCKALSGQDRETFIWHGQGRVWQGRCISDKRLEKIRKEGL
jgi:hypothetical protein